MTYLQLPLLLPVRKKSVKKPAKVARVAISSLVHPPRSYRMGTKSSIKIITYHF